MAGKKTTAVSSPKPAKKALPPPGSAAHKAMVLRGEVKE